MESFLKGKLAFENKNPLPKYVEKKNYQSKTLGEIKNKKIAKKNRQITASHAYTICGAQGDLKSYSEKKGKDLCATTEKPL